MAVDMRVDGRLHSLLLLSAALTVLSSPLRGAVDEILPSGSVVLSPEPGDPLAEARCEKSRAEAPDSLEITAVDNLRETRAAGIGRVAAFSNCCSCRLLFGVHPQRRQPPN